MKKIIFLFSIVLIFVISPHAIAQTLQDAKKWYLEGEYEKALPVFENLMKTQKNNASINHWYGVCLYETGGDLKTAKNSLEFASKRNVKESYYYLSLVARDLYDFDLALDSFERYEKLLQSKAGKSKAVINEDLAKMEALQSYKESLKESARMVKHVENVQIIDSIIIDKNNLLSAYHLAPTNGSLMYLDEFFDLKQQVPTSVFLNEKKNTVYFSDTDVEGKLNLFSMEYLLDKFSNKKTLSKDRFGIVGDIAYPYVMPDGVTMYFAAKDENSIGGYDLFVTRYNINTDIYLKPQRLSMPFNSIGNDYLYVIDEEKGIGWFATDRNTDDDFVCVYTFIPNSNNEIIQGDDKAYLASRAFISSLKDSWKQGVDYSSLISLAKEEIKEEMVQKKDFDFVVNDNLSYYGLSDFKSEEAKTLFQDCLKFKEDYSLIEGALERNRESYINDNRNLALANEIATLENTKRSLYFKLQELAEQVRNLELGALKEK